MLALISVLLSLILIGYNSFDLVREICMSKLRFTRLRNPPVTRVISWSDAPRRFPSSRVSYLRIWKEMRDKRSHLLIINARRLISSKRISLVGIFGQRQFYQIIALQGLRWIKLSQEERRKEFADLAVGLISTVNRSNDTCTDLAETLPK